MDEKAFSMLMLAPVAMARILPREVMYSDLFTLATVAILLFIVELVFFLIPGISLSTLLIGLAGIALGFLPVFLISLFAILAAHFLLKKDISMFVPDILTLIPLVAYAAFLGSWTISTLGWPAYGVILGLVKWGVAIPVGFMTGRNMAKRYREVILEPIVNGLIFWKLVFIFEWLF